MNTIREEFKEEHLSDVQRWWIRKPATVLISITLTIAIIFAGFLNALIDTYFEIRLHVGYAKQCWRGKRD